MNLSNLTSAAGGKAAAAIGVAAFCFVLLTARHLSVRPEGPHVRAAGDKLHPDQLRVSELHAVPLDYGYTYWLYTKRGYSVCPRAVTQRGWLYLQRRIDCSSLFQDVLREQSGTLLPSPPKLVPSIYRAEYLLEGFVKEGELYKSNVYNGHPDPHNWTEAFVDEYIEKVGNRREGGNYGIWDNAIYNALDSINLKGQTGLVIGSEKPWVEAAALFRGASHMTTSEYRAIISTHPRLSAFHPKEMAEAFLKGSLKPFDFAASFSSIEHSGLGRYGDPLDPQADLREVEKVSCLVKPGGLFFLGFPFNSDAIMWNAHRIYGPIRLPMTTANWEVLTIHSHERHKGDFDLTPTFFNDDQWNYGWQLVAVLKNKRTSPCS